MTARGIVASAALFLAGNLLAAAPAHALPAQYHVTDLGPGVWGEDLNIHGELAVDDGRFKGDLPAVWTDGDLVDLPTSHRGAAYDINDSGVAVGWVGTKRGGTHAAKWTADGQLVDLGGYFAIDASTVYAVNAGGDCAMTAVVDVGASKVTHVFFAPGCENPVDIGTLHGATNHVSDLNADGELVGWMTLDPGSTVTHAIRWSSGVLTDMGVCRGTTASGASGINAAGHIVGFCSTAHGSKSVFDGFYFDGTSMIRIGSLGGAQTEANDINDADVIVGRSQVSGGAWHPFVLDRGAARHPLQDLQTMLDSSGAGWAFTNALKINGAGQILVEGRFEGDKPRRAVLTPVE